jgi:hypothetical protein
VGARLATLAVVRLCYLLIAALCLPAAEVDAPPGILKGLVQEVPLSSSGDLHIRSGETVYRCRYDARTYFERSGHQAAAKDLRPADRVEIVVERLDSTPCYARTVRVAGEQHAAMPAFDGWMQRGNQSLNGVILRLSSEALTLRTRAGEEKSLLLRPDTRYVEGGVASAYARLRPNTRVFIRAGDNLDGKLEAYQIVWGELTGPSVRQSQ